MKDIKDEIRDVDFYKKYISGYIDVYLENDDELTTMNEKRYREIQKNDESLTRYATELFNNKELNAINDTDKFYMEIQWYLQQLLK